MYIPVRTPFNEDDYIEDLIKEILKRECNSQYSALSGKKIHPANVKIYYGGYSEVSMMNAVNLVDHDKKLVDLFKPEQKSAYFGIEIVNTLSSVGKFVILLKNKRF